MGNEKFAKTLARQPQSVPPIWMMRQAGRYHQHYQALRKQHSFIELCKNPQLAAEVALGPVEEFDFDVSILFSDLLFPLEALGMGLKYEPSPELGWYLQGTSDFKKWNKLDVAVNHMRFQGEAMKETRKRLPSDKSLIGFVGSPWTLFVYAVAGSHQGSLVEVKKRISLFKPFCETMVQLLEKNIQIQLDGGAEVVMLFDTAAGELATHDFTRIVQPALFELAKKFPNKLGYYSKNTLPDHLGAFWQNRDFAGIGYDHRWQLRSCFEKGQGFVQGNFDQAYLFLPKEEFEVCLLNYLLPFQVLSEEERAGWVCGLGHGVLPNTPEANVKSFVRIVREIFQS